MSSQPPRRRPSPGVYRRRRLVVLLVLLAVVAAVVWLFVAQPWASAAQTDADPAPSRSASVPPAPTPSSTPVVTPTPEVTAGAEPPAPGPLETAAPSCTRSDVAVDALTDQDIYAEGQNPQLSIRLTNTSDHSCTINVGTTTQSFTISSGNDTWWRSTDCQSEPSDMIVTLQAGQTVESATPVPWDRTRSSVDTCGDQERTSAGAGGASYHLAVEIGGIGSSATKQFLLY